MSPRLWKEAVDRWAPVVAGGLLAVASPVGWQEGAAAVLLALLGLALPAAASPVSFGFGYALLAAATMARGGQALRGGIALLAAGMVAWMIARPGRWPARLLPAVGLGALGAALLPVVTSWLAGEPLARAEGLGRWPFLVVCFAAVLLFFARSRVRYAPRPLVALGLALAAVAGLWRLSTARTALAESAESGSGWERAAELARNAGWTQGERDARIGLARSLVAAGVPSRALEVLPARLAVDARSRYVRAEAMLAERQGSAAMDELYRGLLARIPGAPQLSAAGLARLGLWEARLGRPAALEHLARGVDAPQPERFLGEAACREFRAGHAAEAGARLALARRHAPESPFTLCAVAELEPGPAAARACLERVPTHQPSLQTLAQADASQLAPEAGALLALPDSGISLGGVLQLLEARLDRSRVRAGESFGLELSFRILSNGAPDESYQPFVELHGPGFMRFPVAPSSSPAWVRGEIWRFSAPVRVPETTAAGPLTVVFGMQSATGGVWLQPSNQPGHLQIVEAGRLEVSR